MIPWSGPFPYNAGVTVDRRSHCPSTEVKALRKQVRQLTYAIAELKGRMLVTAAIEICYPVPRLTARLRHATDLKLEVDLTPDRQINELLIARKLADN